jgi:hypothetical protein
VGNHHWGSAGLALTLGVMWLASFMLAAWRPVPAAVKPGAFAVSLTVTLLLGMRRMLRDALAPKGRHSGDPLARMVAAHEARLDASDEAWALWLRVNGDRRPDLHVVPPRGA